MNLQSENYNNRNSLVQSIPKNTNALKQEFKNLESQLKLKFFEEEFLGLELLFKDSFIVSNDRRIIALASIA